MSVKPDWTTAKNLLADPSLVQQLLEFDKENVSNVVLKKIRTYVENPQFVPEVVAKVTKAASALCLWVRAVDFYAKVYKTIEPKRLELLDAETELAEAMTALREETDRVTHMETTIKNLQESLSEKVKKQRKINEDIVDLHRKLGIAETLSCSLEEEYKKWKNQLAAIEKRLMCLVGDCLIGGMIIAYGGEFSFKERECVINEWKHICQQHRISISDLGCLDIFESLISPTYLRADALPALEYYQQNCLIAQKSKKWILFEDPDTLALVWIRQAASKASTIIHRHLYDKDLIPKLKTALNKGYTFFIDSFNKDFPDSIRNLIEYEIYEKLKVFVGLIGIPEKRKELKCKVGTMEVTVHPRFKLYLRAESVEHKKELQEFLKVVNFKMSPELFETHMQKKLIELDQPGLEENRLLLRQKHLERKDKLEEEKNKILHLLFKARGDLLIDDELNNNITDIKASLVKATRAEQSANNASEILEEKRVKYLPFIKLMTHVYSITEKLTNIDPNYNFSSKVYLDVLTKCWNKIDKKNHTTAEHARQASPIALSMICELTIQALQSSHKIPFLILFIIKAVYEFSAPEEEKESLTLTYENFIATFQDDTQDVGHISDEKFILLASVRFNRFLSELKLRNIKGFNILPSVIRYAEQEFSQNNIEINVGKVLKRIYLDEDSSKPILIIEKGSLNVWWLLASLATSKGGQKPQLLVMGKHLDYNEINMTMSNCKKMGRWVILQGLHNQKDEIHKFVFPETGPNFRIYATMPTETVLPTSALHRFKLQHIDLPVTTLERIESLIYLISTDHNIEENLKKPAYKSFLACIMLNHVRTLQTDRRDDYSDLELRLLLETYDKFIRKDVSTRYNYLTRMASIIYQTDDLEMFNETAEHVADFEMNDIFSQTFLSPTQTGAKSKLKKWAQEPKEIDTFLKQIVAILKSIKSDTSKVGIVKLADVVATLKILG